MGQSACLEEEDLPTYPNQSSRLLRWLPENPVFAVLLVGTSFLVVFLPPQAAFHLVTLLRAPLWFSL